MDDANISVNTTINLNTPQRWPWHVCVLVAAIAVALDLLFVEFPLPWLLAAGGVAVLAQFRSPLSGLAVVIFTCGLANYSPFETGALSRLYPGNIAIGLFVLAWLLNNISTSPRTLLPRTPLNRPLDRPPQSRS